MLSINTEVKMLSGDCMPVLGLGTWTLKREAAIRAALEALANGYRMIDTSGDYGNQEELGEAIEQSGKKRSEVYVVTKVEEDEDSRRATEEKLEELGLDYADLILVHRPPSDGSGVDLWEGLITARDDGLTKSIGVSNYSIEQMEELFEETGERPAVNQIEWSPFGHSRDMLDYCEENNIVIQAYSPLTRAERLHNNTIEKIGKRHGKSPAQILIRWNLQLGVVPLPKASSKEHILENIDVFDFELNEDEMEELKKLNENYSALGQSIIYR